MKKFILQYLIMACTMVYAGPPLAEAWAVTSAIQSSILAEWGLQYCLQYDKENLFEPIEKDELFALHKDVAQGRLDLQKYFDDNYYYLPNAMSTLRFRHCMDIFGFEKYRSEVERIVKKYCEYCK